MKKMMEKMMMIMMKVVLKILDQKNNNLKLKDRND